MSKLDQQIMISSYSNISFNGERRGAQDFEYYTDMLREDLAELGEVENNYKSKFIDRVMTIYHRQISCASSMITGPANFNVRRNQKRWDSRDKAQSDFDHWRTRYFKAVNRVRTLSPEAELDLIPAEIDMLMCRKEKFQLIKKCKTSEERGQLVGDLFPYLSDWDKEYLIDKGITYHIPSLTTKIRERKKKLLVMKARIEAKESFKTILFDGGSIYLENDRVIISHDNKPESDIIQEIKKNGFKWSPKMGNWCRKHTANARYSANLLLRNVFGGEIASV